MWSSLDLAEIIHSSYVCQIGNAANLYHFSYGKPGKVMKVLKMGKDTMLDTMEVWCKTIPGLLLLVALVHLYEL